jgi:hypothetical protein
MIQQKFGIVTVCFLMSVEPVIWSASRCSKPPGGSCHGCYSDPPIFRCSTLNFENFDEKVVRASKLTSAWGTDLSRWLGHNRHVTLSFPPNHFACHTSQNANSNSSYSKSGNKLWWKKCPLHLSKRNMGVHSSMYHSSRKVVSRSGCTEWKSVRANEWFSVGVSATNGRFDVVFAPRALRSAHRNSLKLLCERKARMQRFLRGVTDQSRLPYIAEAIADLNDT